ENLCLNQVDNESEVKQLLIQWNESKPNFERQLSHTEEYFKSQLLISKNVDSVIEEMVDFIFRDFFLLWYKDIVSEDIHSTEVKLKNEVWQLISRLISRLKNFDDVSFLTKDIVICIQKHIHKITAFSNSKEPLKLYDFLETKAKEIEFLRKLANVILICLLPEKYARSTPLLHLLREILANHVLYNAIDLFSDPTYINEKILDYIKNQKLETEKMSKSYAYAANFEEFIKMINKCTSVDELKRIRYYIMNEIMESVALNKLKKERYEEDGKDLSLISANTPNLTTKGVLLLNRDLKRYINQLTFAKRLCNKRIASFVNFSSSTTTVLTTTKSTTHSKPLSKKVYKLNVIMRSQLMRSYFRKFLQYSIGSGQSATERTAKYLVMFWESVEEMKNAEGVRQYQIANELLTHSYFLASINNHAKIPKNFIRGMQLFIKGDKGPEAFYDSQTVVFDILENRYYPLYMVSKEYNEMVQHCHECDINDQSQSLEEDEHALTRTLSVNSTHDMTVIENHIKVASSKLQELRNKLHDKTQALTALKNVPNYSSSNTNAKLISVLEKEIDEVNEEIHQVNTFIQWGQQWIRHLLQWKAEIHNLQFDSETKNSSPLVITIIHLDSNSSDKRSSGGWVVAKTINEFIELKRKLVKIKPELKRIEILRLKNVSESNVNLVDQGRRNLQSLLTAIFTDECCLENEDVFLFFCPNSNHLRHCLSPQKCTTQKSSLPFANLLGIPSSQSVTRSVSNDSALDDEEIDQYFNFDELESKDNANDNIAESLYSLANEIFELSGAVGLLRKSLIAFVQLSFGHSMNKQLRETISWMTSESMVLYYLVMFRDSFWQNGQLVQTSPEKTRAAKKEIQLLAKQQLSNNIPEILNKAFGNQIARNGLLKIFEFVQRKKLNKQLIYDLLEAFMLEFAPELTMKIV
ncbi:sorting nexin-25-like protein, partial [Leptotrombidium deliense]